MERMKELKVGDLVEHRVHCAKKWGFGIVRRYRRRYGLYEIMWPDGETRTHIIELLKQIA